jgi:hypothetical protein
LEERGEITVVDITSGAAPIFRCSSVRRWCFCLVEKAGVAYTLCRLLVKQERENKRYKKRDEGGMQAVLLLACERYCTPIPLQDGARGRRSAMFTMVT